MLEYSWVLTDHSMVEDGYGFCCGTGCSGIRGGCFRILFVASFLAAQARVSQYTLRYKAASIIP